MNPRLSQSLLSLLAVALMLLAPAIRAATFDGTARVDVSDPTGGLGWSTTANAMTVSCWFKLSVPSTVTLSKNMVILANARRSDPTGAFAYLIQFNIATGNVEFTAGGTSPLPAQKLIERPYLDRWYHVAVTRSGGDFAGYVDGRTTFTVSNSIGSSANTAGLFIGGTPDDGANLYGEVQEVAIYSEKQQSDFIAYYMLQPQPVGVTSMRGYFKLGGLPNPDLANYATTPPTGTNPAAKVGNVLFEDTDRAGEQSTFDSRKNGGRDAMTPLSGSFAWQHTLLRRATVGVPFEFMLGYNSATANNSANFQTGTFGTSGLSAGWTHTFDARIIPADKFLAISDTTVMGLLLWDGSLEVWDGPDETNFTTRHGEYRGELKKVSSGTTGIIEWTTPDRLVYRFRTPFSGPSVMRGRLLEIRDLNPTPNVITLNWDTTLGRLNSVTDTAGATCQFNYNAQNQLTSVAYLGWTATFTYNAGAGTRLATITTTGPAAYTATPPLPTTWSFSYRTSTDVANGLLEKIADPRGQSSVPVYYDTTVTYDEFGRVKQEADALARSKITKYNVPAKRQITHTDALTKDWIETFDRKSHVTEKKDPLGNKTTFEYDAAGNISASVDPITNRTELTYDTRANVLTKKVVALNETTTWEYSGVAGTAPNTVPLNKPTKQTDPPASHNGQAAASWVSNFQYDAGGNLLRQFDALGDLVTNTYNARGQLLTAKDARNNIASFTYKPEGFLATKTVPDVGGATRTWTYDYTELGWLKTETNPLSLTAYYFQNINGQVVTTVDPLGRDFQKTYDAGGNLLTDSDGLHIATTYTYDNAGQRLTMLTRDGKTWTYGYTLRGEPQFIRDPTLTAPTNTVAYLYDDAGHRTRETDALGFFTQLFYDANGNLTKTTDKESRDWTKKYDALNRVTEDTDPETDKTVTTYDPAGRIATITNPRGFVSLHAYDGRNRLTKWTDAANNPWIYAYDGNGNIENITDALGGHYVMTYGPRNERLTELNQDGKQWSYTYDELLRLKTQADPTAGAVPALVRTLHYDNGGRVESADFSTGRQTVFFFNDNNDPLTIRRTFPGQPSTTLDLTYDIMDRVTQSRDTFGKTVGYTFDFAGRVKTKVYPGSKTLTQTYDAAGRLTSLVDWASRTSTFTYDNVGRLKTHLFPNGLTAAVGYDTAGRVTALDHGPAATPQQLALRYAYDRNGNKTSETKKGALDWQPGTAAGQVAPFAETYTSTAAGRLITSTDTLNSARNTTYTYNPAGDLTASASPAASYTFTYDEDHRVTTVGLTGGATTKAIANRYDALGRRLARTLTAGATAPVETRYVLDLTGDMERILADTDNTGTILTRYIHGPDGLGYREDAATSAITCYHADAIGNILRITDATGTALADYTYSPYGRLLASTGTAANPYRFVGSQGVMEELPNLYFMRARYYSAETGIFLSIDPVKNVGPGWKPMAYGYGNENPTRFTDPNGKIVQVAVLLAVVGGLAIADGISDFLANQRAAVTNDIGPNEWLYNTSVAIPKSLPGADKAGNLLHLFNGLQAGTEIGSDGLGEYLKDEFEDLILPPGRSVAPNLSYLFTGNGRPKSIEAPTAIKQGGGTWGGGGSTQVSSSATRTSTPTAANYASTTNATQQTKLAPASSVSASINTGSSGSSSPTSSSGSSSTITIKSGQTLSGIAAQTGNTVSSLLAANPQIKNANVIYAGAKISVPSGGKRK